MQRTNHALENARRNPDITVIEERPIKRKASGGGKKKKLDGYTFDSGEEAKRYAVLALRQRSGLISNLIVHPKYVIQPAFVHLSAGKVREVTWEADFSYMQDGLHIIEDYKGDYLYPTYRVKLPFILHFFKQCHVFVNHDIDGWYSPPSI